MAEPAELAFADQVSRFFSRQYGVPPLTGRVAGWLLICDPPEQTAAEIATELGTSRSGVGAAVAFLEQWRLVRRSRPKGERADRISFNTEQGAQGLDAPDDFAARRELVVQGLELLKDASLSRRGRLLEIVAYYDFLHERSETIDAEWAERLQSLRAAGLLPDPDGQR